MSELAHHEQHDQPSPIATLRNWSFGIGALLVLLGAACFARPLVPSLTINFFIGGALLAGGILRVIAALGTYSWKGFWLTLLCGVLAVVSGTAMLALPGVGIEALVVFLGLLILFEAAAKLMAAFSVPRDFPWGWLLVDGLITAVLGGILFTASPEQAPTYLGIIIAAHLLASGVMLLGTGFWLNRATN
jgi:membrane protein HdeD